MSLLATRNVTKRFGGLTAVNDVSISVEKGQIVGIIGPNGAGKTTLFNCIAGAFPPTTGEILLDGRIVSGKAPYEACGLGIARTFQVVKPFAQKSVLYNVMVGAFATTNSPAKARGQALEVIAFLQLDQKQEILAKSLTLPDRKRLELARALATRPKVLLLDEVMAGLRPSEVAEMIVLIGKIRDSGVTLLIVEHIMQAIMSLSDHIFVLNFGQLIAEGSPNQIANNEEVIKAYLGAAYAVNED